MKCLIPNIGSTSFKYRVLEMPEDEARARPCWRRAAWSGSASRAANAPIVRRPSASASRDCRAGQGAHEPWPRLEQSGSKLVHAGPLNEPQLIDDAVLAAMEEFSFLAPAHNPPYIAAMKAFRQELPGVPLVAVMEPFPTGSWTRPPPPMRCPMSGARSTGSAATDFTAPAIARPASEPRRCWAATICGTSPAISAAVRAWPPFETGWPST